MKSNNHVNLASTLGLSLVTSPFIFSFLALRLLTETLVELGQTSEELFRAARLPILHFSDSDH